MLTLGWIGKWALPVAALSLLCTATTAQQSTAGSNPQVRTEAEISAESRFREFVLAYQGADYLTQWRIVDPRKRYWVKISRWRKAMQQSRRSHGALAEITVTHVLSVDAKQIPCTEMGHCYLAAAARETGGRVIGSEIEPEKLATARANMERSGVADIVDIRAGDALQSLWDAPDGIDFLLLDGWKDLYQPVLDLLHPKLAPGAVVVADNIFTFKTALRPYVERMQARNSGFRSSTVAIGAGMEFSVKLS